MALLSWKAIELPKKFGELSVGNLLHGNLAILFKWLWRYVCELHALWRTIIQSNYQYPDTFNVSDLSLPKKRRITKANLCNPKNEATKNLEIHGIRMKVGNGLNTLFWHDKWIGNAPPQISLPQALLHSSKLISSHCLPWFLGWLHLEMEFHMESNSSHP